MRKLIFTISAAALTAMVACTDSGSKGGDFTLTVPFTAEDNGHMVYLTDYDTDARIDSVVVVDGVATFNSHVDAPYMGRLMMDGKRRGMVVVEPGNITIDAETRQTSGTPSNDNMTAYNAAQNDFRQRYMAILQDSAMTDSLRTVAVDALNDEATALDAKTQAENAANPFGLYLFIQGAYELNLQQMDSALAANPSYASSSRLQKLRNGLVTKDATSAGKKFADFEVVFEGDTARLSDHVGKGHYTLVDFWASWCGPCIRETKTIKKIFEAYPADQLEVLGVAVWDEPENTRKAIVEHELPWGQIINSQNIATDAYGIPAIPCIILFDPEGTIVFRDLQGEELEAAVAKALAPAPAAE